MHFTYVQLVIFSVISQQIKQKDKAQIEKIISQNIGKGTDSTQTEKDQQIKKRKGIQTKRKISVKKY
jgi:hypothetical protein